MGDIMSEGEVFQLTKCSDINLTEEEYFSIIEKKTAVLISALALPERFWAPRPLEKMDALARFGKKRGHGLSDNGRYSGLHGQGKGIRQVNRQGSGRRENNPAVNIRHQTKHGRRER